MNATRRGTIVALALACAILLPAPARAGANETPGVGRKPHTYSAFLPVTDEFGLKDDGFFRKWVVGDQHFTLGTIYTDKGNDAVVAGADPWNFFHFCTDRTADVMLVSSHGLKAPIRTLIAKFDKTARGKAVRDSLLAYYTGIFAAGTITGPDFADSTYGICVTQAFYTTYFMTPQAFCWWATCYSGGLSMTGAAEARCYLGYDVAVSNGKCWCDENTVLRRMDGQEGQLKRPLSAALAGINATCPDAASLQWQGRLNTVLSPSVLDYEPKGIVCTTTPGFVYFDCTLDTAIPPAAVVSAYGGGVLVSHAWAGDDKVTYTVVPIVPCPVIFYDVHEATTKSLADNARLDGNTNPAVNAKGPNQDDFVWVTTCPYCNIPVWNTTITTTTNGDLAVPGNDFLVYTPVVNNTPTTYSGSVTFHVDGLTLPVEFVPLTLTGGQAQLLVWSVPIPSSAVPGQTFAAHLTTMPSGQDPYVVDDTIHVSQPVQANLHGLPSLSPGADTLAVELLNNGALPVNLTGLGVTDVLGWGVSVIPGSVALVANGTASIQVVFNVPPTANSGDMDPWSLTGIGPAGALPIAMDQLSVHLPVEVRMRSRQDCVPGTGSALVTLDVINHGNHTLNPTWLVQGSHGWAHLDNFPSSLAPGVQYSGTVQLTIPLDETLIGTTDDMIVHVEAEGLSNDVPVPIEITPEIEIDDSQLTGGTFLTGWNVPHPYAPGVSLINHSDQFLTGTFHVAGLDGLNLVAPAPSVNLAPHSVQSVPVQVLMPVGFPARVYAESSWTTTSPASGNAAKRGDVRVSTPVTVDMRQRTTTGSGGTQLVVYADVTNRRPDRTESGSLTWTDARGWIIGPPVGTYNLGPGQTQAYSVTLQLPVGGPAAADTDSVSVTVAMTYDTGAPASTRGIVDVISTHTGTTGVPGSPAGPPRTEFVRIAPNPIGGSADVRFRTAVAGPAVLSVIDLAGRRVATLLERDLDPGEHHVAWNGHTDSGARASVGVYFVRLQAVDGVRSRKIVLMR